MWMKTRSFNDVRLSTEDVVSTDKKGVSTDLKKIVTDQDPIVNTAEKKQREGTEEKVESTVGQIKATLSSPPNEFKAKLLLKEKEERCRVEGMLKELIEPRPTPKITSKH
ncbi:hypothetical protein Tco_0427991 [Tanacetum coccineum]